LIRIIVPMEIQQGRAVRPIKPLLSWELKAGVTLSLPVELEAVLIREGFAAPVGPMVNTQQEGK
jgi:hypothetical protein